MRLNGRLACPPGDEPSRAPAHVHHEDALAREVARRARERQRRLALARHDGQRDARIGQQGHELVGVAGIARGRRGHGRHGDAAAVLRLARVEDGLVAGDHVGHVLHGLGFQHAGGVHALAQVRDGVLAPQLVQRSRLVDVGHEHAARHRADVDGGIAAGTQRAGGRAGRRGIRQMGCHRVASSLDASVARAAPCGPDAREYGAISRRIGRRAPASTTSRAPPRCRPRCSP